MNEAGDQASRRLCDLCQPDQEQEKNGTPRRVTPLGTGDETFEIVWVGDILLGDAARHSLEDTATPGHSPS